MKKLITYIFFAVISVIAVGCGYAKFGGNKNYICDQQYALCTSAKCIPDPNNPNKAVCFCEVHNGKSLGLTPCDKRTPYTDDMDIRHIVSTFSLDDFYNKEIMTCASGKPWTDCLDQACTIDPTDPSKSICVCKVVRTGAFQTLGGSCNESTCEKSYWSGATVAANSANIQAIRKALKKSQPPQRYCPK